MPVRRLHLDGCVAYKQQHLEARSSKSGWQQGRALVREGPFPGRRLLASHCIFSMEIRFGGKLSHDSSKGAHPIREDTTLMTFLTSQAPPPNTDTLVYHVRQTAIRTEPGVTWLRRGVGRTSEGESKQKHVRKEKDLVINEQVNLNLYHPAAF